MRLTFLPAIVGSAIVGSLLTLATLASADDTLQQAETLLNQHQPEAALQLLTPLEDARAGEPAYDYLLGLAYLAHQEPTLAAFAFERCLGSDPKHGPCRVHMARTHLAMGETANARTELNTIQAYNPPPAVQALVSQYLGMLANHADRQLTHRRFIQLGLGMDSNTNSATEQSTIALPAFNNALLTVDAASQQQESTLLQGVLSSSWLYKTSPNLTAIAEANGQFHSYEDNSDYSYQTVDLAGGAAWQQRNSQWLAKLQLQKMWLGGDSYREAVGVLGQYQYQLSREAQVAAYLQGNNLRYDQYSTRDAQRVTAGLAYSTSLTMMYSPVLFGGLYSGQERTKDAQFDAFSQDFSGVRVGGRLSLTPKLQLNGSVSAEQRAFKANYPLFNAARDEQDYNLTVGMIWRISGDTSLQPNYSYTRNNSNIALTDYQRHVVAIDVRFDL